MPEQQLHPPQISPATLGLIATIEVAIIVFMIISLWKVFTKAGEPGWAAIIPFYNAMVFLKIAGKPMWWFILLIIPGVGLIIGIFAAIGLAERFGKGGGYVVGLILVPFIFIPMLAFGDARYLGSNTDGSIGAPALS